MPALNDILYMGHLKDAVDWDKAWDRIIDNYKAVMYVSFFNKSAVGDYLVYISGENRHYGIGASPEYLSYALVNPPIEIYNKLWIYTLNSACNPKILKALKHHAKELNKNVEVNNPLRGWFVRNVIEEL